MNGLSMRDAPYSKPAASTLFARKLARSRGQVWRCRFPLNSHKSHVISEDTHVPKTEIYSSERDIKIDSKGSLSEYPDGFLDEWGNQLMELLR